MRDFDAAVAEAKGEPLVFTLGGVDHSARTPIPASAFLAMLAHETKGVAYLGQAYQDFLCAAVEDPDALRQAVTVSQISTDGLLDILRWLVEEGSARPTTRPANSVGSDSETGPGSSAAVSRKESEKPSTLVPVGS